MNDEDLRALPYILVACLGAMLILIAFVGALAEYGWAYLLILLVPPLVIAAIVEARYR